MGFLPRGSMWLKKGWLSYWNLHLIRHIPHDWGFIQPKSQKTTFHSIPSHVESIGIPLLYISPWWSHYCTSHHDDLPIKNGCFPPCYWPNKGMLSWTKPRSVSAATRWSWTLQMRGTTHSPWEYGGMSIKKGIKSDKNTVVVYGKLM
jgi:hypothetical protein